MLYVECGANLPNDKFIRNQIMPENKTISFRFKYNNTGVFKTAYTYDNINQMEANLTGDFYLDLDYNLNTDEDFDIIRKDSLNVINYMRLVYKIEKEDIQIYFSGSKGIHLIINQNIFGITPYKNLNRIFKLMAEDIVKVLNAKTIDLKIYDNRRLFRMINSIHPKTNLYKIPLLFKELKELNFGEIKGMAAEPRIDTTIKENKTNIHAKKIFDDYITKFERSINKPKKEYKGPQTNIEYIPPCIEYILKNPIKEGHRNDTLALLTSYYKQNGLDIDQATTQIQIWNDNIVEPSIKDFELTRTIQSIYNGNSYTMGCSKAKNISNCDEKTCKFHRKF